MTGGTDVLLNLKIERPSSLQANLSWSEIPNASTYSITLMDPRTLLGEWEFYTDSAERSQKLPVNLKPGHTYKVTVRALKIRYRDNVVVYQTIKTAHETFRAELTQGELKELCQRAEKFGNSDFVPIVHFYRNKPDEYFNFIQQSRKGIMEAYLKDDNGDPGNPINGKINGLFFATGVDPYTGRPPSSSFFGEKRLYVPAAQMMFADSVRLYFSDFYCNHKAHYVTLVLTNRGSTADKFCETKLLELNLYQNPFLYKKERVYVVRRIHVEVLYTENIDLKEWCTLHGAYMDRVEVNKGTSTPGGLAKNPRCSVCNLFMNMPEGDDEIN